MAAEKIRLLFADDSSVVRKVLETVFKDYPELEIVGIGKCGVDAFQLFKSLSPDVVVLDVEMPELNGVEACALIRRLDAQVPIIMFSSLTAPGTAATLDALDNGATDYACKPMNAGHLHEALAQIRQRLVPKIIELGRYQIQKRRDVLEARIGPANPNDPGTVDQGSTGSIAKIELVLVGSSTGGAKALFEILHQLPASFPVPILIAQHMPEMFTQLLAERLNHVCPLTVRQAIHNHPIQAGEVWLASGGSHLSLGGTRLAPLLKLSSESDQTIECPSVDRLFHSASQVFGDACLAMVLTGMGIDGTEGCRHLKAAGSTVFAQDRESSVVWGMPRNVIEAGLADRVISLNGFCGDLVRYVNTNRSIPLCDGQIDSLNASWQQTMAMNE